MAMITKIKWRPQDEKKLQIYVRKFNAAITRLEKKNPDAASAGVFPERINIKEARSQIYSRNDYNRLVKRIDRLFKEGARDIITDNSGRKVLRYQKKEEQYLQQSINAKVKSIQKKTKLSDDAMIAVGLNYYDLDKYYKILQERREKTKKFGEQSQANINQDWFNFIYSLYAKSSDEYFQRVDDKIYYSYLQAMYNWLNREHADALKKKIESIGVSGHEIAAAIALNPLMDFEYLYSAEDEQSKYEALDDLFDSIFNQIKEDFK